MSRTSPRTGHPLRSRATSALLALAAVVAACTPGAAPTVPANPSIAVRGNGCPTSQPPALAAGQLRTVTLTTAKGDIVISLAADLSPIAVGNFAALVACGFYDGTVFHRTATLDDGKPYVIQGGDPTGTGGGGPGYTIADEPVTAPYSAGVVAMARTSQPHSVGSQFFIVLSDEAASVLASYDTFQIIGKVTSGMDVALAIHAASNGAENPAQPIAVTKATITNP